MQPTNSIARRLPGSIREVGMALAVAAGLWLAVMVLVLCTSRRLAKDGWECYALESLACLVLLIALALHPAFRAVMLGIGRLRLIVLASVVGLVVWGQLVRDYTLTYPFVHWSMFTNRVPNHVYIENEVTYADGSRGPFPFEDLAVYASIQSYSRRIRREVVKSRDQDAGKLRGIITTLMEIHNKRNPGNPIVKFTVIRCKIPLVGYAGLESIEKIVLFEVADDE